MVVGGNGDYAGPGSYLQTFRWCTEPPSFHRAHLVHCCIGYRALSFPMDTPTALAFLPPHAAHRHDAGCNCAGADRGCRIDKKKIPGAVCCDLAPGLPEPTFGGCFLKHG